MAKFEGFKCDGCWKVIDGDERTREIIKYEGARPIGTFARDLCPDCVVVPRGMTKTSRGPKTVSPPSSVTPGGQIIPSPSPPPARVPEFEVRPPEPVFPDPIQQSRPPILGIDYGVRQE